MIDAWIKSVFLKRALLAAVAASAAAISTHAVPTLAPALAHYGITLAVTDPDKLKDGLTILFVGVSQGAHEWVAARWPNVGQWI